MKYDVNYFMSNEFENKDEITIEEMWALDDVFPVSKSTNETFTEMFVFSSDDGEMWINWNGKLKHIKQEINNMVFF